MAPRRGEKVEKGGSRDAVLAPPATFVPVTPCRIMDTRQGEGKSGAFGPPTLAARTARTIPVPLSSCGIPAGASAYSLNITVVPKGPLSFLTVYPTGQGRPNVSTLNSFDGDVVANGALVPAGFNGAIDIYVNDSADVVMDINGYLGVGEQALRFYTIAPCRVMDTRSGGGKTGSFGPPSLVAGVVREVAVPASGCPVPVTARGFMVNVTVIPKGVLGYLTVWPTGQARPLASTLNSFAGRVVANAAIIPAGTGGAISIYATDASDVVLDIAGYLAP
ncbi:MAG: hypothetical protein U0R19_38210 [Bryobacteraceae bacterium]